ncbi:TPA: hypothetical protein I6799_003520 [Vibrio cholerae]|nr:hypothetical protein VCSRO3_3594 [Vibrio cholerae]HAS4285416.1 hypothetical protein [Vibrio cholerae]HAS4303898.1 hypothetical protein [Vibrio cholerae]HAS4318542.1 hypothetical protein [Vibrio cholerae]HAS4458062.1 hypothetical protein [Vibrio cholerae]
MKIILMSKKKITILFFIMNALVFNVNDSFAYILDPQTNNLTIEPAVESSLATVVGYSNIGDAKRKGYTEAYIIYYNNNGTPGNSICRYAQDTGLQISESSAKYKESIERIFSKIFLNPCDLTKYNPGNPPSKVRVDVEFWTNTHSDPVRVRTIKYSFMLDLISTPIPNECSAVVQNMDFGNVSIGGVSDPLVDSPKASTSISVVCKRSTNIRLRINGGYDFNDIRSGSTVSFSHDKSIDCDSCEMKIIGIMTRLPASPGSYHWSVPLRIEYD